MGCLKSFLKNLLYKIIAILLLIAFFAFGGWAFTKKAINNYKNPQRSEFIRTEKNYADFSQIPSDYQLSRNFNIFGYKKISAKYLPTGQKITICDLKTEEKVSVEDFRTGKIDSKIKNLLDNLKDSFITFEEFEIVQKGEFQAKGKKIPYIKFNAKVKNVPFKNVVGILACYSTTNEKAKHASSKLIMSIVDKKAYNPTIISGFIQALKF